MMKQEFNVGNQWVEFSELQNFYPNLFELANQKCSNGISTENATVVAAEISRIISCLSTRYIPSEKELDFITKIKA